jgi:hypothetical protein
LIWVSVSDTILTIFEVLGLHSIAWSHFNIDLHFIARSTCLQIYHLYRFFAITNILLIKIRSLHKINRDRQKKSYKEKSPYINGTPIKIPKPTPPLSCLCPLPHSSTPCWANISSFFYKQIFIKMNLKSAQN